GYSKGIPETFGVDRGNHVPYGASMCARDLYGQTFDARGWVDVAVFRGSCIYGPHQFGVRQQGWISWFTRAVLEELPITILGD
ncbi:MAG: nucleoside-diphosphate sugar epimerase, partial [Thermoplasmata archaeon]|nr:nucleoside-diphosphate sugar epimerase [Thermoplasmata archaeon]NIT77676.1 nucleoside-diphosphate sugar epimerase [Thermoplasmata archaeon]NIU49421.1 nucleoside-diphosphate sugar epimerase [Thermoplasmata archaeon]NIW82917.1 nucleoside-diphosphate sugar epimerase [Thermoplasmata archaeon]NIY04046.1 nucleoside-diphosphate sugar epimerase [Thermoplasmata archaeon]